MSRGDRYKILSLLLGVILTFVLLHEFTMNPPCKDCQLFDGFLRGGKNAIVSDYGKEYEKTEIITLDTSVPLIWIGGVPRSGTTLSRAILDSHPEIRCGEETRVLPKILGMHVKMLSSEKEMSRLNEAKVTEEVLDYAVGAYVISIISMHGDPAPRLCNKDPFTLKYIPYISKLFPNSKFLLMVRDGRAVANSIFTRKIGIGGWDTKSFSGLLKDWNRSFQKMYETCLKHKDVCMPVQYEKLVLDPEPMLRKVLKFLDVPWNDVVLHHEDAVGKDGGISLSKRERSTDQVIQPVNTGALYKWIDTMPPDIKKKAGQFAPFLKVLGYDPDSPIVNYSGKKGEGVPLMSASDKKKLEELKKNIKKTNNTTAEIDSDKKIVPPKKL